MNVAMGKRVDVFIPLLLLFIVRTGEKNLNEPFRIMKWR